MCEISENVVFKILVLSNHQSKAQRYSMYNYIMGKAENLCLYFLLINCSLYKFPEFLFYI